MSKHKVAQYKAILSKYEIAQFKAEKKSDNNSDYIRN